MLKAIVGGLLIAASQFCSASSDVVETQTAWTAKQCAGCTAAQMQSNALAAPGLGVIFEYDAATAANVVRKYYRFNDTTCKSGGGASLSSQTGGYGTDSITPPGCGGFRNIEQDVLDASVSTVFNALLQVKQVNPNLVLHSTAQYHNGAGSTPIDSYTGQPFNLPNIALDYPGGTYSRFMSYMQDVLANEASANGFAPGLGTYLNGFQKGSSSITVSVGTTPVSGTITWDHNGATTVDMCDVTNNCVNLTVQNSGTTTVTFINVTDASGEAYPSPNVQSPQNPNWNWHAPHGGGGSEGFGNILRGAGYNVTESTDGCGQQSSYYLSCAWDGHGHLIGCNIYCN